MARINDSVYRLALVIAIPALVVVISWLVGQSMAGRETMTLYTQGQGCAGAVDVQPTAPTCTREDLIVSHLQLIPDQNGYTSQISLAHPQDATLPPVIATVSGREMYDSLLVGITVTVEQWQGKTTYVFAPVLQRPTTDNPLLQGTSYTWLEWIAFVLLAGGLIWGVMLLPHEQIFVELTITWRIIGAAFALCVAVYALALILSQSLPAGLAIGLVYMLVTCVVLYFFYVHSADFSKS